MGDIGHQFGFKKEVTWGTAVVVDRFLEFTSESLERTNIYAALRRHQGGPAVRRGRAEDRTPDGARVGHVRGSHQRVTGCSSSSYSVRLLR